MTRVSSMFAVVLALAGPQAQGTSGTFAGVSALDIIANYGTVEISAWAQPDVQVTATHSDRVGVEIKHGATLEIREHRPPRASLERVDYVIRVPASTAVKLWSDSATVTIRGVHGDLEIHGQHGDISVADAGNVALNSTTGDLVLDSADGTAVLEATAGTITASRLAGDVTAESVGGPVVLDGLAGASVRVTTTGGEIRVSGTPPPRAVYDIASQAGAVTLRLPSAVGARVTYGTVRGHVRTDLPEAASTRSQDGTVSVSVGDGSASIVIITFSGDITILRDRSD
jgi:Toastrack DUF4097